MTPCTKCGFEKEIAMTMPNEWMKIIETISKEAMQQYEEIRALGPCNMLDLECVKEEAEALGHTELAALTRAEFLMIFKNYFDLMHHYEIERL
jgi:hypothetical protein